MEIILNGEAYLVKRANTVSGLLDELGVKSELVAVEINMNIIKRADYINKKINGGDRVEIVNFVGGG
ncbi:MAG: sulfur carrier protein ThiS [Candidatus Magnetoovum sp. WYHC-5]|nr:sulfur carrier protein ThiS [Candidatus Magnetoovum sp. WYHC-5]